MPNTSLNIGALGGATGTSARARVLSAIEKASVRTGVDFSYLLAKATQESGLDAQAKAKGSSATGLFQFIDQTWLKTVKAHGKEYGLGTMADEISVDATGTAHVADAREKDKILALRTNPEIASIMAAELAQDNKESLQTAGVGHVGATELYLAHFLGSGGAKTFLKAAQTAPATKAADLLPQAAAANKGVFYDGETGRAKSVSEIYAFFQKKFDAASPQTEEGTQIAQMGESLSSFAVTGFPKPVSFPSGTMPWSTQGVSRAQTPLSTVLLAQMDMETFGLNALSRLGACEAYEKNAARIV